MKPQKIRSHCPVNFVLEIFGDKWSLLILRDIVFRGKKTYGDFLKSEEKFATNILATRLEMLEAEGILKKTPAPEDARKIHYLLTEKGLDLIPILFEMVLWSDKYDPNSESKRIPELVRLIQKDNRSVSERSKDYVRDGVPIVAKYLKR